MSNTSHSFSKLNYFLFFLSFLVFVLAIAVILEYEGPWKGWVGRFRGRFQPPVVQNEGGEKPIVSGTPEEKVVSPETPAVVKTDVDEDQPDEGTIPEVPLQKTELEKHYDELFNGFLAAIPKLNPGDKCRIHLRDGRRIRGAFEKITPGKITLRLKHGTLAFPVHLIKKDDVRKFFPEILAHEKALAQLHREISGEPELKEPEAPAAESPEPTEPAEKPKPLVARSSLRYDPTPAKTPDSLKPTLVSIAAWLKTQHRRSGGKIVDKMYAKNQSGNAVLYMVLNPMFLAQDYEVRYQIAAGVQQFWALRCQANGIAGLHNAHIVLVSPDGRHVGGSRVEDAAEIWVPEK